MFTIAMHRDTALYKSDVDIMYNQVFIVSKKAFAMYHV